MKIMIVVPAYNEGSRISKVIQQVKKFSLPIIIVDDGSKDTTYEKIKKIKNIVVLKHRTNLGKGAALKTGSDAAFRLGADAVIIMDSDGQHKPTDIPKFVESLKTKKYQVIFGVRNFSMGMPFVRFIGNKFASVLINTLFGIYVSDLICGYRAYTKKAYQQIVWQSPGYGVETEMVIKTGKHNLSYCEVLVETVYLDKFKGVTMLDAFSIFLSVLKWRLIR